MAQLGKSVKGKSKAAQHAQKAQAKRVLDDIQKKLDANDIARKAADETRRRLKEKLRAEQELCRMNQRKIQDKWRQIMRMSTVEGLRKDIEMLSQFHERNVDRKDAIIQMLERDLEESDEQYLIALRRHLQNMDRLIEIQDSRLLSMETSFQASLKELEAEFAAERRHMEGNHERECTELRDIMAAVEEVERNRELGEKHDYNMNKEDVKNRNTEELNILKNTLEAMITNIEQDFESSHENYLSKTDSRTQEFKRLTLEDHHKSKEIEMRIRKLDRLQTNINHWRAKIKSNCKTCDERNQLLRNEIDLIMYHYKELKKRMNEFREIQAHRLTELTKEARTTSEHLNTLETQCKNLLLLAEQARKLETEREKVLPFYESTVEDEEVAKLQSEIEMKEIYKDDESFQTKETPTSQLHAAFTTKSNKSVSEWNCLDTFFKKYNKVLLDQLCIQRERDRLLAENQELENLLKRYLDGITVNDDVMASANPLLIVNGRTNAIIPPVRQGVQTVQEGNMLVHNNRLA